MAKFNIKSIVLSMADDAIDKDFDIIAENIFPTTRIYEKSIAINIREEKDYFSYDIRNKRCFNKY
jgi:hypothetical protein